MCKERVPLLKLAMWFGLLTGFGEVFLLGVKKFILHRIILLSPHAVWMVPMADVFFFLILGLFVFLVAKRWPRSTSLGVGVFAFAFLGFLSLLLLYYPLSLYAKLLLAAGFAMQLARFVTTRKEGFYSLVERTLWGLVVLVVCMVGGTYGYEKITEHLALARLPPAALSSPNLLLIVLDTVRASNLSLYGYTRPTTPNLERLAKKAVVFDRAMSTSPWTLPSHASMFTGRFDHELSVGWENPLDNTYPTLAESFRAKGYLTAGFVANTRYCGYEFALDRGFLHYEDFPVSPAQVIGSSALGSAITDKDSSLRHVVGYYDRLGRKTAANVTDDFFRWLSLHQGRPFFVFLNYFDAHDPYSPPKPFDEMFGPKEKRANPTLLWDWKWTFQEIQKELKEYDNSIAYLDHQLGLLFDQLKDRGVLQNTLVIVTSDHGEQFGEHGLMSHGNSLYLQLLHVPLLMLFPGHIPEGVRVREPVTLRDIPSTVIDLMGLRDTFYFPGTSLARFWTDNGSSERSTRDVLLAEVRAGIGTPDRYPVSKGDMKSLITDQYHYIKSGDGSEELYDFDNDPQEMHNLAALNDSRGPLEWFRTSLKNFLKNGSR